MERFASLINSLKTAFEGGRPASELLGLLHEMSLELTGKESITEEARGPVSVLLPKGYSPGIVTHSEPSFFANVPVSADEDHAGIQTPANALPEQDLSKEILKSEPAPEKAPFPMVEKPAWVTGVPRPPLVAVVEEAEDHTEEQQQEQEQQEERQEQQEQEAESVPESIEDDFLLPGNYHIGKGGIFHEPNPINKGWLQQPEPAGPEIVRFELQVEPEFTAREVAEEPPVMTIAENFLKFKPLEAETKRTPELHEILANRVVAQPAPAELPKPAKVLADSLAGGKITDLRKSISINDRFRFIKSLFRGDENLFDRSVKTINNFNILQEAQYWMQRELIIKLGWNEEDELVQMFYQLISRRFL